MTKLRKPVYREVAGGGGSRDLIVGLEQPGILTFREKRTRKVYTLGLQALFVRAVMEHVESERAQRNKLTSAARHKIQKATAVNLKRIRGVRWAR